MKKIGFIGTFDKTDLLLYVAKMLQLLGHKVLVVDATLLQKTKYIVPSINPTKSYVTDFENIDFAIGFEGWDDIEKYLGIKFDTNEKKAEEETKEEETYDYVLLDIDSSKKVEKFGIEKVDKNYFVTSFDMYSLNKGMTIFEELKDTLKLTKVLFSYESATKEEEEYLNSVSVEYKIEWGESTIYFQIFNEDIKIMQENQRLQKLRFRRLSQNYKDSLAYLIQDIDKSENFGKIKKAMKD